MTADARVEKSAGMWALDSLVGRSALRAMLESVWKFLEKLSRPVTQPFDFMSQREDCGG